MNKQLHDILAIIEQDNSLTPDQRNAITKALEEADKEFAIISFKLERTEKVKKTTGILLEETIQELEQKRKAIEEKNRELKIESALEKVRTAAMAMNKRNDMINICRIIMEQLEKLKVTGIRNVQTAIFDEIKRVYINYEFYSHPEKEVITEIPYDLHPVQKEFAIKMMKGAGEEFEHSFKGEEIRAWIKNQERTGEYIDPNLYTAETLDYHWYSLGPVAIGLSAYRPLSAEEIGLFTRFRNVFQIAYRRYLDIEKAEKQAREAKIETALERVRARTMAMQQSSELPEAATVLFDQVDQLGIPAWSAGYCVWEDNKNAITLWMSSEGHLQKPFKAPLTEDPSFIHFREAHERGETFFVEEIGGQSLIDHYKYLCALPVVGDELARITAAGFPLPTFQIFHLAYFSKGFLLFITYEEVTEAHDIFKRFANVFEQTYTRFLDLQKSEAQAREAQIEAALERVRAKVMAMKNSADLTETSLVFGDQLRKLGVAWAFSYFWLIEEDKDSNTFWITWPDDHTSMTTYPLSEVDQYTAECLISWQKGEKIHSNHIPPKDSHIFFETFQKIIEEAGGIAVELMTPENFTKGIHYSDAMMKYGSFGVCLNRALTPEEERIQSRFAIEFERAYTRFLELQKAELQTREAQIDVAVERVRAKALAMHSSEDLHRVVVTLKKELQGLHIRGVIAATIYLQQEDGSIRILDLTTGMEEEESSALELDRIFKMEDTDPELWVRRLFAHTENYFVIEVDEADFVRVVAWLRTVDPAGADTAQRIIREQSITRAWLPTVKLEYGRLNIDLLEPPQPEIRTILLKIGAAFDLAYRRFLDLQKAEAQAREARIEASLERVRSKAMAMHSSEELEAAISTFYHEIEILSVTPRRCGVAMMDKQTRVAELFTMTTTEEGESKLVTGALEMKGHPILDAVFEHWLEQKEYHAILRGSEIKEYYRVLRPQIDFPDYPHDVVQYGYYFMFREGDVVAWTDKELTEDELKIYRRFTTVLSLTFKRYMDLQHAEAQAREARIEASLERVRSKAMAMHDSQDLADTIGAFYKELKSFEHTPRRCGVGLLNEQSREGELFTWNTTDTGESLELVGKLKMEGHPVLENVYRNWLGQKEYHPVLRGKEINEYYRIVRPQIAFPEYENDTVQYGYFFFFKEGGVYAWTEKELSEEELNIYRRFTSVLSLTYKRYRDLQHAEAMAKKAEEDLISLKTEKRKTEEALAELRSAQAQLIQAEKMASLGELTAGIAHEIQNPLNFVNNFSEVSNELIDEMIHELENKNEADAIIIAGDVKQNLEKILHHGKRADDIVKGMLQHSRSSSGQKEPTSINELADEYLRLSYHGLRAKDKSFNAKFITEFDPGIGKVNIIPQDMGRVILNLINNAFYAVSERKKNNLKDYEPVVIVTTKKINDRAEIRVRDNGSGIPERVLDKIFQPFFTTKPTGQGTGLGLSLSYDIVKAHGGELKVDTKEGEGSEFIIQLPV